MIFFTMSYIITALVSLSLGFIAGALVFRKNAAKIQEAEKLFD